MSSTTDRAAFTPGKISIFLAKKEEPKERDVTSYAIVENCTSDVFGNKGFWLVGWRNFETNLEEQETLYDALKRVYDNRYKTLREETEMISDLSRIYRACNSIPLDQNEDNVLEAFEASFEDTRVMSSTGEGNLLEERSSSLIKEPKIGEFYLNVLWKEGEISREETLHSVLFRSYILRLVEQLKISEEAKLRPKEAVEEAVIRNEATPKTEVPDEQGRDSQVIMNSAGFPDTVVPALSQDEVERYGLGDLPEMIQVQPGGEQTDRVSATKNVDRDNQGGTDSTSLPEYEEVGPYVKTGKLQPSFIDFCFTQRNYLLVLLSVFLMLVIAFVLLKKTETASRENETTLTAVTEKIATPSSYESKCVARGYYNGNVLEFKTLSCPSDMHIVIRSNNTLNQHCVPTSYTLKKGERICTGIMM